MVEQLFRKQPVVDSISTASLSCFGGGMVYTSGLSPDAWKGLRVRVSPEANIAAVA